MIFHQHSDLVLAFARILFVNGQSTGRIVAAVEQLAQILRFRVEIVPRWGELHIQARDDDRLFSRVATPSGVNMQRVAAATRTIGDVQAGQLAPDSAVSELNAIEKAPLHPTWLFTLAATAGAVALAVIFGVEHLASAGLILLSAAAGAVVRRALAQWTTNAFAPPFCAALLA